MTLSSLFYLFQYSLNKEEWREKRVKCAVHIKKLKSGAVGHIEAHNKRTQSQKHTDASKQHLNRHLKLHKFDNFAEAIADKIETLATKQKRKVRSDAVVLVDVVLIASPEYFRDNAEAWGEYDNQKMIAYARASLEFLKREYGDRLISVDLHLDEATPHIHANVVPVTQDGRLSAKEMFGRQQLSDLQTKYAESMQHLGLERGQRNSVKTHTESKDYYKQHKQLKNENKALKSVLAQAFELFNNHAMKTINVIADTLRLNDKTEITPPAKPTAETDKLDSLFSRNFFERDVVAKTVEATNVDPKKLTDRQLLEREASASFSTNHAKHDQKTTFKMTPK